MPRNFLSRGKTSESRRLLQRAFRGNVRVRHLNVTCLALVLSGVIRVPRPVGSGDCRKSRRLRILRWIEVFTVLSSIIPLGSGLWTAPNVSRPPLLAIGMDAVLAVGFSSEQSGELGGSDVGMFAESGHVTVFWRECHGEYGLPFSARVVASLWSTGCCHQIVRGLSRSEPVSAVLS